MIRKWIGRPAILGDDRGTALMEFAMTVPVLILLFVGGFQISDGVFAYRKVTQTAKAVADLTSQYASVTDTDLTNILNASQQILAPYSASAAQIIVSEVTVDTSGNAKVVWSKGSNISGYTPGATFYVSPTNKQSDTTIIVADISYAYTPPIASTLLGAFTMKEQVTMYPRKSDTIPKT